MREIYSHMHKSYKNQSIINTTLVEVINVMKDLMKSNIVKIINLLCLMTAEWSKDINNIEYRIEKSWEFLKSCIGYIRELRPNATNIRSSFKNKFLY